MIKPYIEWECYIGGMYRSVERQHIIQSVYNMFFDGCFSTFLNMSEIKAPISLYSNMSMCASVPYCGRIASFLLCGSCIKETTIAYLSLSYTDRKLQDSIAKEFIYTFYNPRFM